MIEQAVILFFLIVVTGATLFLYLWKAKKEVEYKKDERWKVIQIKSNTVANYTNYVLLVLLAIADTVSLFSDIPITFNRVLIYATLFIGIRNVIELCSLNYFDRQM